MSKTRVGSRDSAACLRRALKAADWFVNAQIGAERPWMSDHGRFLYYYFIPGQCHVPGLNWTHGRALFVLTEAFRLTGKRAYMDSMELGARYLCALQPLDPWWPVSHGSIREEIPQSSRGGILDGAQAASGFLMLYLVTRNPDHLRRGRAFCDLMLRTWRPDVGFAANVTYDPDHVEYLAPEAPGYCIHQASAIPLWHLHRITGEGQYTPPIIDAADRILQCQRADGAMRLCREADALADIPFNHHWGLGETKEEKALLRNDDAMAVVVEAAYMITRDRRYLDALVRYAEWIQANEPHVLPYNAFGVQAATVFDVGKLAGKDYLPWILDNLRKHCLGLQATGTGDPRAEGGFRGEDEEGDAGIFGGDALDYVTTRTTCYMAGLLYRLSGKGHGAGFSLWGLGD